jgi:hypothetical protein
VLCPPSSNGSQDKRKRKAPAAAAAGPMAARLMTCNRRLPTGLAVTPGVRQRHNTESPPWPRNGLNGSKSNASGGGVGGKCTVVGQEPVGAPAPLGTSFVRPSILPCLCALRVPLRALPRFFCARAVAAIRYLPPAACLTRVQQSRYLPQAHTDSKQHTKHTSSSVGQHTRTGQASAALPAIVLPAPLPSSRRSQGPRGR